MLAPNRAALILDDLTAADFTDPRHAVVLTAMREVLAAGGSPDPVCVLAQLRHTGATAATTAARSAGVLLADLVSSTPTVVAAAGWRRCLLEHTLRRTTVAAAVALDQAAGGSVGGLAEVIRDRIAELAAALRRAGLS